MLKDSTYIGPTEAHVPLAQGREGIPPFTFPTGLCNDALPPLLSFGEGGERGMQQRVFLLPFEPPAFWVIQSPAQPGEETGLRCEAKMERAGSAPKYLKSGI